MAEIIGICGGSGSGKTTLLNRLKMVLEAHKPTVLSMDNYYKPLEQQVKDENGEVNFDLPTSLYKDKLVEDVWKLKRGEKVYLKEYQYNASDLPPKEICLTPSTFIIVEGLFTLHYEELREQLNYSIYVELDKDEQLRRRILRDVKSRGYDEDMIKYQWKNHVEPCYAQFLQPYRSEANFVFHNDHRAAVDFDNLLTDLQKELNFK